MASIDAFYRSCSSNSSPKATRCDHAGALRLGLRKAAPRQDQPDPALDATFFETVARTIDAKTGRYFICQNWARPQRRAGALCPVCKFPSALYRGIEPPAERRSLTSIRKPLSRSNGAPLRALISVNAGDGEGRRVLRHIDAERSVPHQSDHSEAGCRDEPGRRRQIAKPANRHPTASIATGSAAALTAAIGCLALALACSSTLQIRRSARGC